MNRNFEYVNLSDYIQESFTEYKQYYETNVNLYKTISVPHITLSELENYDFPLKINSSNLLNTKFYAVNTLSSKLQNNEKIGCMNVYYENKILCSLDVLLENQLEHNRWEYYFRKTLKDIKTTFEL